VTIYGTNLATTTATWNGDFPTSLGGVTVTIDGRPAYLWFVGSTQINLQVPDDSTAGPVKLVISNSTGSVVSQVTLAPASPSFIPFGDGVHVTGVIATPDGSGAYGGGTYDLLGPVGAFAFSTRPARPGEVLLLYGTGFGPTNPFVPAGKPSSGAAPTLTPVTITIGGVPANVAFAGITSAGLYQLNVTVPDVGSGDMAVQGFVNGAQTSPGPLVTVQ
jgi:uncharacterized protein (TIGR03437 family)